MKRRRNSLSKAASFRKKGPPYDFQATQWAEEAKMELEFIRLVDARLGILDKALNERSWSFEFDLADSDLLTTFGFGMDENGNSPAL